MNEVYDPATDTWQTKASLPSLEWPLQASVVDGQIYVIGRSGNVYAYNSTSDSWTRKTVAPSINSDPIAGFVTAVLENKIYVIGIADLNLVYNPVNDTWSQLRSSKPYKFEGLLAYGSYTAAAGSTIGVLAPKRIYVFFEDQTYTYEVSNDTWISGTSMSKERVNYGLAVVNDTFYVIGGGNNPKEFIDFYTPSAVNEQYTPFGYGTIPPEVAIVSPENQAYNATDVSLVFPIDKPVVWMGYSLDGQDNVTVTGNTTITGLSNCLHSIVVHANDTFGNMGVSRSISFTVAVPEPFPTTLVAAASVAAAVVVGVGLLVYFKKRKR